MSNMGRDVNCFEDIETSWKFKVQKAKLHFKVQILS